ncbi:MAG: hypothetical protein HYV67_01095 [Candidatus Taylorbacteria bacterium]|nr:hypothetical protein [Candidatus Taylorbacteria bacterium]
METKTNNHKLYECKLFFDFPSNVKNSKEFISRLVQNVRKTELGFLGFSKKEHLKNCLERQIFDVAKRFESISSNHEQAIEKTIETEIHRLKKLVLSQKTHIYIFPTFSDFVLNKMSGISGYTPWKDIVFLFVHPKTKNINPFLNITLAHEYVHSVSREYHEWNRLLDTIVFEGLAELFIAEHFNGYISPWTKTLTIDDCHKYLAQIRKKLKSKNHDDYRDVFFKNKMYPLWAGYSIGYQIVRFYRQKNKNITWNELLKKEVDEIFENSGI